MFKFQNPNLSSEVNDSFKKVTLNLEAGEELNEVSDVDSIQSFTDDDVLDLDHEKRIRAKVSTFHFSYIHLQKLDVNSYNIVRHLIEWLHSII